MTKRQLRKQLKEFSHKTEATTTLYSGALGIYIGGHQYVDVPNRPGFVYVRLRNNTSELIQAHNEVVSPVYGLPVILVRNKTYYEIYGRDSVQYASYWDTNSSYLPKHGSQHEFDPDNNGGGDLVFVHGEQFYPMMAFPSGTDGGNTVLIAPYRYYYSSAWHYAGDTGAGNLLQYGPTGASNAKLLLVGIDATTGNPFVKLGSEFDASITGAAAMTSYVPTNITQSTEIPGAIIRLVTGTSTITWANIYDARQYMGILQAGGGATDFLGLSDTPNSYTGQANKIVTVKPDESGLEFVESITGTAIPDHDHSGDVGDGGQFLLVNLSSGGATDGEVATSNGLGGITWEIVPTQHEHILNEDHSSECSGTTTVFNTVNAFIAASTQIYLNGLRQRLGTGKDYTEGSALHSIIMGTPPLVGDNFIFDYLLNTTVVVTGSVSGPYINSYGALPYHILSNYHGHTTASDGALSAAAYVAQYAAAGYGSLAISDHDVVTSQPTGVAVRLAGEETSSTNGHILSLNCNYDRSSDDLQTIINGITSSGGFAVLSHPNWTVDIPYATMAGLTGYTGLEIHNAVCIPSSNYQGFAVSEWDSLLTNVRRNIWGFSDDDFHNITALRGYNIGRNIIFADSPSASDVVTSIVNGNFVADVSNFGVVPAKPTITLNDINISVTGSTAIRFIGDGGTLLSEVTGSVATYNFNNTETYVRIEAVGDYTEGFDSDLDWTNRWGVNDGTWSVGSGLLSQSNNTNNPYYLFLKRHISGDFEFKCDVRFANSAANELVGFLFGWNTTDFYYLWAAGAYGSLSNRLVMYYNRYGSTAVTKGTYNTTLNDSTWYTIRWKYIYNTGNHRARIWPTGDVEPASWHIDFSSTADPRSGMFAFRTRCAADFDNLYINGFKTYYQPIPRGDW